MLRKEILDEILQNYQKPEDLLGEGGIIKELTKALVERCLNAEMEVYMEKVKAAPAAENAKVNRRERSHYPGLKWMEFINISMRY